MTVDDTRLHNNKASCMYEHVKVMFLIKKLYVI